MVTDMAMVMAAPKTPRPSSIDPRLRQPSNGDNVAKRLFDLIISILALSLFWPALLVVAILVRKNLGAPVLFVQQRPGRNGIPFNMIKFRTMLDSKDALGNDLPDGERLTRFGAFLRSTSLDELPELWNILKGDMSLVGPRPLLMQYLPLYTDIQARRHELRPGITGWAQINGRNALSWADKFKLDVWYVDNRTFFLDIRILILTVLRVFQRHGVNAHGDVTMPAFTGREDN